MPVFFNNCKNRPHADLFGPRAFYDLNRTGEQANMALNLQPGAECVVATRSSDGDDLVFTWFSFSHEETMPAEDGALVRVLFGDCLRSETLPRSQAIATDPYSAFFNVNGHFKRRSVVEPKTGPVT